MRPLSIALVSVSDPKKPYSMNKDLNGGFGTANDFGVSSPWAGFIARVRSKSVKLPIVSFAYLQAILKAQGHHCEYFEDELPNPSKHFDVILTYGSIVDHIYENTVCALLKESFPQARVGVFGSFASRHPGHYPKADFVLAGEPEGFFQLDFKSIDQLEGYVSVPHPMDLENAPTPDFDGFPIRSYRYFPALSGTPFLTLLASKGCPYSCRAYCTYGEYQGAKVRIRPPELVVRDLRRLKERYGVRAVQFRDPTFGLGKNYMKDFSDQLMAAKLDVQWGIETRSDLLTPELLEHMSRAGLKNLNIGVETSDPEVAKSNRRVLIQHSHQSAIINACRKNKVNVSAFYIIGLEADTAESVSQTINYAVHLNTNLARFSVFTPYPGTKKYAEMLANGQISEPNLERYTQFNLVFKHPVFDHVEIKKWLAIAAQRYYGRPTFLLASMWRHYSQRVKFGILNVIDRSKGRYVTTHSSPPLLRAPGNLPQ